ASDRTSGMPSLVNDGPRFFPNVLADPLFRRDGVLFGSDPAESAAAKNRKSDYKEGDIEWAVVDPRRHIMYVWDKEVHGREDFVVAAKELGASVVTNSSFNVYEGGSKWWATLKVGAHLVVESLWARLTYTLGGMVGVPYVEDDRVREI